MIEQLLQNAVNTFVAIYTAPNTDIALMHWKAWVCYTVVMCMVFYLPLGAPMVFGIKHKLLTTALKWVVIGNVVLAIAPLALGPAVIIGIGWVAWQGFQYARRSSRSQRRPRRGEHRRRRRDDRDEGSLPWDREE